MFYFIASSLTLFQAFSTHYNLRLNLQRWKIGLRPCNNMCNKRASSECFSITLAKSVDPKMLILSSYIGQFQLVFDIILTTESTVRLHSCLSILHIH